MEYESNCIYGGWTIVIDLDSYIKDIETGFLRPPCYDHLECAVSAAADIDVIEYILKQGVPPGNVLNYIIFSPEYNWVFGEQPNNFTNEIVTLLFEYGAGYDSYMLDYLNEETKELFLDLERQVLVSNIKG